MVNNVATVVSIGDSVILPPAKPGVILQVANNGANSMTVYAQGSDTINGVAAATGVSQMAGSTVTYTCLKAGTWTAQGIGAARGVALKRRYPTICLAAATMAVVLPQPVG
jgi:hypothetical protein